MIFKYVIRYFRSQFIRNLLTGKGIVIAGTGKGIVRAGTGRALSSTLYENKKEWGF